jgi:hypothetical protein
MERGVQMNPTTSSNLLSLIQLHYPGGLVGFKAAGGNTFAFPNKEEYLICCENLPELFVKNMRIGAERYDALVEFFPLQNFQHESIEEVRQWTIKFVKRLRENGLADTLPCINPCTIYVEARSFPYGCKQLKDLENYLMSSPEIVRAHIQCKDRLISIGKERKPKQTKEIQPDAHPITEDDIFNLKIDLHSVNSVEDFLKTF